jgi:hypothetical protein
MNSGGPEIRLHPHPEASRWRLLLAIAAGSAIATQFTEMLLSVLCLRST